MPRNVQEAGSEAEEPLILENGGKIGTPIQILRKTQKSTIPQIQKALEMPRPPPRCPRKVGNEAEEPLIMKNMEKLRKNLDTNPSFLGKLRNPRPTDPKSSGGAKECPGSWEGTSPHGKPQFPLPGGPHLSLLP